MKLLGSTENKISKDRNGENVPYLEITEKVLVHCNIVNNNYQHESSVLYIFVPNKPFGNQKLHQQVLSFKKYLIQNFHILKYGLQNSQPLEIEDGINLT